MKQKVRNVIFYLLLIGVGLFFLCAYLQMKWKIRSGKQISAGHIFSRATPAEVLRWDQAHVSPGLQVLDGGEDYLVAVAIGHGQLMNADVQLCNGRLRITTCGPRHIHTLHLHLPSLPATVDRIHAEYQENALHLKIPKAERQERLVVQQNAI